MLIKNLFLKMLMKLLGWFPIKNNKVFFLSYYGNYCNDNPRFISDQLYSVFGNQVDIVWGINKEKFYNMDLPRYGRIVKTSTIRYLYELATSKIWIDNCRKSVWVCKRPNQYYIQTWHGNLGNKRVEKAAIETLPQNYIVSAKKDAKNTDLMISGSEFFTNLIRNYFWYDGEILECGTPRLDKFLNTATTDTVTAKRKLGISDDTNCILYAPTFRKNHDCNCYDIDFSKLLEMFETTTKQKWVFLIRLHPGLGKICNFIKYNEKIINVTNYSDLYELIPASEIIISDYSSLTFEAILIDKPVFLYVKDLDNYIKERGFYMNIYELPFILAQNNSELLEKITNFNKKEYLTKIHDFITKLGIKESGNASKVLVERIMNIINDH